jgi:secreted trypsin-like serine protease
MPQYSRSFVYYGEEVTKGTYQYLVAFKRKAHSDKRHFFLCSGSVLDEWHVLTAAHCVVQDHEKFGSQKTGSINMSEVSIHLTFATLNYKHSKKKMKLKLHTFTTTMAKSTNSRDLTLLLSA